jgi:hypothetical protein
MTDEAGSKGQGPPGAAKTGRTTEGPGFVLHDTDAQAAESAERLTRIDFSTFVISLAASGLHHLGMAESPQDGSAPERNLPLARQTIETLEMLEVKTAGNLEVEEAKLLQSVLYELRMSFVKASG